MSAPSPFSEIDRATGMTVQLLRADRELQFVKDEFRITQTNLDATREQLRIARSDVHKLKVLLDDAQSQIMTDLGVIRQQRDEALAKNVELNSQIDELKRRGQCALDEDVDPEMRELWNKLGKSLSVVCCRIECCCLDSY